MIFRTKEKNKVNGLLLFFILSILFLLVCLQASKNTLSFSIPSAYFLGNRQDMLKIVSMAKKLGLNIYPQDPLPFNGVQWISEDRPTLIYDVPSLYFLGDREVMIRTVLTAKKMGWNVFPREVSKKIGLKQLKNAFGMYVPPTAFVGRKSFPDNVPIFVIDWIVLKNNLKDRKKWVNFMNTNALNVRATESEEAYIDFLKKNSLNPNIKGILACTHNPIDINVKKEDNNLNGLNFITTWYPTVQKTNYNPNPVNLMYSGDQYLGNLRLESEKYKKLWKKLDATEYFFVYGSKYAWGNFSAYQGYIPADGESFVRAINQHGICLVMHNTYHLREGLPSARIFEAAAAAAVIISDKNAFIEREFKDSVLYIDETRNDLFEQIEAHMRWILENPEKAKAKAKMAHAIFLEKFTLEQQLERIHQKKSI